VERRRRGAALMNDNRPQFIHIPYADGGSTYINADAISSIVVDRKAATITVHRYGVGGQIQYINVTESAFTDLEQQMQAFAHGPIAHLSGEVLQ
jgi:hypothetical protein